MLQRPLEEMRLRQDADRRRAATLIRLRLRHRIERLGDDTLRWRGALDLGDQPHGATYKRSHRFGEGSWLWRLRRLSAQFLQRAARLSLCEVSPRFRGDLLKDGWSHRCLFLPCLLYLSPELIQTHRN